MKDHSVFTCSFLFIILFSINCLAQKANPVDRNGVARNSDVGNKVIKITTKGNTDEYYSGAILIKYKIYDLPGNRKEYYIKDGVKQYKFRNEEISSSNFPFDSIPLTNNDVMTKLIDKKEIQNIKQLSLMVKGKLDEYKINEVRIEFLNNNDTLTYELDYDKLEFKELENKRIEQNNLNSISTKEDSLEFDSMMDDIQNNIAFYEKKLNGKTRNQIADFLYDEGFSRDFYWGSTLGEKFECEFKYDGFAKYRKSYTIIIRMWYSYGFGNLYCNVEYSAHFKNKFFYSK